MSNSPRNASLSLVQAKIAENRRIQAEAAQKQEDEKRSRYDAYIMFWQPIVDEILEVAKAFPERIHISAPPIHLGRPYRLRIDSEDFDLERFTGERVGVHSRSNARALKADSKEALLPQLLELIAEKLS